MECSSGAQCPCLASLTALCPWQRDLTSHVHFVQPVHRRRAGHLTNEQGGDVLGLSAPCKLDAEAAVVVVHHLAAAAGLDVALVVNGALQGKGKRGYERAMVREASPTEVLDSVRALRTATVTPAAAMRWQAAGIIHLRYMTGFAVPLPSCAQELAAGCTGQLHPTFFSSSQKLTQLWKPLISPLSLSPTNTCSKPQLSLAASRLQPQAG